MAYLYSAEPCDATDPAPGVRLIRNSEVLNRLSRDEARSLASDLLAAAGPVPGDPSVVAAKRREWKRALSAPNAGTGVGREFAAATGWGLFIALGHYECGTWSYQRETGLVCSCGTVLDEPEEAPA